MTRFDYGNRLEVLCGNGESIVHSKFKFDEKNSAWVVKMISVDILSLLRFYFVSKEFILLLELISSSFRNHLYYLSQIVFQNFNEMSFCI